MKPAPAPAPADPERIEGEDAIDEALVETFPASDAPAWTTGVDPGFRVPRERAAGGRRIEGRQVAMQLGWMRSLAITVVFALFAVAALLLGSGVAEGEEPAAPLRVWDPGDGGPIYVGDPPGELRLSHDPSPPPADAQDGGTAQSGELKELRSKVAALEQQNAQPRNDVQTELLQQMNVQLAEARDQLAQAQATRVATESTGQQARARLQQSVVALEAVQERLAFGDSQVTDALDAAVPGLPYPAQAMVQDARAAVLQGDLASARYWLSIAAGEAQRAQLAQ